MKIDFTKMNGLGNDFIMIDDMDDSLRLTEKEVADICDRHFGVGGDGVILVRPSKHEDRAAYMHYINSDGTLAQMCGNGVRCFAKWLVDHNIVDPKAGYFTADTLAGPRPIAFQTDADGKMTFATVNMGKPILDPGTVPVNANADSVAPNGDKYVRDLKIESPWGCFHFICVSMGNPHAVCFIDNWSTLPDEIFIDPSNKSLNSLDINKIGPYFESNEVFPEKTNVEFAEINDGFIAMRVYERGCGETLACGTGACATNVAAVLSHNAASENDIKLSGGILHIKWDPDGEVLMTGPAEQSFTGTLII